MTFIPNEYYWIDRAIKNIEADYGDVVSVVAKNKTLIKYGANPDLALNTRETIWQTGGDETYPTGNNIDVVVSDDNDDTQSIIIEGHTLSGSDLTFVTQTLTLTGTSNVNLTTPLYRANRLINNGSTDFLGTITVKDNGTSTHITVTGDQNQSLKAATSISSVDYYIINGVDISVERANAGSVDFELQIREFGKVWRTRYYLTGSSTSGAQLIRLEPCIIAPKNSDVRIVGTANAANMAASASIHGVLASVV